jgi:hypothetical protein
MYKNANKEYILHVNWSYLMRVLRSMVFTYIRLINLSRNHYVWGAEEVCKTVTQLFTTFEPYSEGKWLINYYWISLFEIIGCSTIINLSTPSNKITISVLKFFFCVVTFLNVGYFMSYKNTISVALLIWIFTFVQTKFIRTSEPIKVQNVKPEKRRKNLIHGQTHFSWWNKTHELSEYSCLGV